MKATLIKTTKPIKRHHDMLLILGDGRTARGDLLEAQTWPIAFDLGAIGRSISLALSVDHWFNVDGESAIQWAQSLKAVAVNGLLTHTMGEVRNFDCDWDIEQPDYHYEDITHEKGRLHGSSSLFATLAAVAMGYQKIILAGCPMDSEGHWYFEPTGPETLGPMWQGMDYMAWIDFAETEASNKVRSMSGYTAKLLGSPVCGWLHD